MLGFCRVANLIISIVEMIESQKIWARRGEAKLELLRVDNKNDQVLSF